MPVQQGHVSICTSSTIADRRLRTGTKYSSISSWACRPVRAIRVPAESLDILFDAALRIVPPSFHSCAPVAVKATAGLRLLGP